MSNMASYECSQSHDPKMLVRQVHEAKQPNSKRGGPRATKIPLCTHVRTSRRLSLRQLLSDPLPAPIHHQRCISPGLLVPGGRTARFGVDTEEANCPCSQVCTVSMTWKIEEVCSRILSCRTLEPIDRASETSCSGDCGFEWIANCPELLFVTKAEGIDADAVGSRKRR
jgi:hypothetical protein